MTSTKPKLFVLITDGVSMRNFAYTNFYKLAESKGFSVIFWHHTPFDLDSLGFKQLSLQNPKLHQLTTIFKNARKRIEIARFAKRDKDSIYYEYLFPQSFKGIKNLVRSVLTNVVTFIFNSEIGLHFVRKIIAVLEQQTTYYKSCKEALKQYQPDIVYCTSQRAVKAIAPMQAAKNLGIPTVCFVFSWDNLPKATLDVVADYYHVWSQHMKDELLYYHPFIKKNQVQVTGTPQFELHFEEQKLMSKSEFYKTYYLDTTKSYLCFSGDDITTSPKDELYLKDVAEAIRQLNEKNNNLGLIFRRCPVDFSNRYDTIISEYKDVIVVIEPVWQKIGGYWDTILPMPEDLTLLSNLAFHTSAVVNLGSSMVFDFVIHQKPCLYMNYNYLNINNMPEEGVYVYNYVHFRSKPNNNVVVWLNHPDMIAKSIMHVLENSDFIVEAANDWYKIINEQQPELASIRILENIETIITRIKAE